MHFSISQATDFVTQIFSKEGVPQEAAESVAKALVSAEAAGQGGHGFRRIPVYIKQLRAGKVCGTAVPIASRPRPAVLQIDAGLGYAYPAIDLAVRDLPAIAREQGIALAAIGRSHHAGVMALTVERFAHEGLVCLMVANAPASMAPWGGNKALYGTNPIAFAAPIEGENPLVIDLALSKVARGKIMAARQKGTSIPDDWAFDINGQPTTDPQAAIDGFMAPAGDAKGAALALMVEVLAASLTGGNFGFQADSLLDDKGSAPSLGHLIIAIDPSFVSGEALSQRLLAIAGEIEAQDGARLPGRRSQSLKAKAYEQGITVEEDILREITAL
jgi:(2R)-3-sulfolactate dehydrogenase (NADP+)